MTHNQVIECKKLVNKALDSLQVLKWCDEENKSIIVQLLEKQLITLHDILDWED